MRTTVRLDDELYRQAKVRAARSGRTVASVIEDALRVGLQVAARAAGPSPRLPTFGARGPLPGVDLTSNAAVLAAMDDDAPVDAKR
ncbi:ribbon-helix-helix protein, CopG family [Acidimicrobiaceae bacterium USS-CC1]|uniref:Ribbon-helix-helix protein, CopG family n=1 Tax=Acidiferrimicrobium australe TaxID=2664430 RepID=A0ABW9QVY1_9ACTN|nr:ribbon-helix-helix protein, CopG family [Acidiferrimicrobium australe]